MGVLKSRQNHHFDDSRNPTFRVPNLESRVPSSVKKMNRIDQRFAQLKAANRTGLIPFVTAGDPSPDTVVALMHALVDNGADAIELGVPFSDPMADGPTIQHADERALAAGVGLVDVLSWVREFRQSDNDTPVVLMGYLNPIEIHGYQAFADDAVAAGVDGVLLVDCPVEEAAIAAPLRESGLRQIWLAAPTTSRERLARLCEVAEGFLYYVSVAGITGSSGLSVADMATRVAGVRDKARAPVAVGFGVRNAEQACAIAGFADAVIIGSALVERLAGAGDATDVAARVRDFLAPIRDALDEKARND